jgi:hypothetical protein
MKWTTKFWIWLRENWYLPLTILAAIVGAFTWNALDKNNRNPLKVTKRELKISKAATDASARAIEVGAEKAVEELEEQHDEVIKNFTRTQEEELDRRRDDPRRMAAWLTKLSEE